MTSLASSMRHRIRQLRKLHRRRLAAIAAVVAVAVAAVVAAGTGRPLIAWAMQATLLVLAVVALLTATRRLHIAQSANSATVRDVRAIAEQMQRRVVAAVEKERLANGDRHRALAQAVQNCQNQTGRTVLALQRAQIREIEALLQLFRNLSPRAPMPSCGDYALNPTDLLEVLHLIEQERPALVLELGSGTSSVWIAYALERHGGRLVSVDQDPEYAQRTRVLLAAHGLDGVAEVRDAPLEPVTIGADTYQWYADAAFADLRDIDFVLIDGPTASVGADARFPALPVLTDRLADRATVVLDDADRPDELGALERWTRDVPGLTRRPEILGRHAVLSFRRVAVRRSEEGSTVGASA